MADDDYSYGSEDVPGLLSPQQQAFVRYVNQDPATPFSLPKSVGGGTMPTGDLLQLIRQTEAGPVDPYNHLSDRPGAPSNAMSLPPIPGQNFPDWSGQQNVYGGHSSGFGAYQFERPLFKEATDALGLTGYDQVSQDAAARWALHTYGLQPWNTNQQLAQSIRYYQRTGQIPPTSMDFPTHYGSRPQRVL